MTILSDSDASQAREGRNRAGLDTRERLVKEALALFAAKGYESTSLAEITGAAEANIAAVNYHFGSKENLYRAALDHCFLPVLEGRRTLLGEIEAKAIESGGQWDLRELLASWVDPILKAYFGNENATLLLDLELQLRNALAHRNLGNWYRPYVDYTQRFHLALVRAVQHLPAKVVIWRAQIITSSMFTLLGPGAMLDQYLESGDVTNAAKIREQWLDAGIAILEMHRAHTPERGPSGDAADGR